MRLICPNCGAQYEVETSLIPETGRDVQCSNCGHGWFQHPEDPVPDDASAPVELDATPEEVESPQRRELDPSVADVLREEAEREAAARRAEAESGLESQPDLGLSDGDEKAADLSNAARARMARLRGLEEDTPPAAPSDPSPRSELLPDVDEINSTLRGEEDRGETPVLTDAVPPPKKRGGFRIGFYLVLFICVIGVGIYALAPTISEAVPQAEPYLVRYVDAINSARTQLNEWVETGVAQVRSLLGSE